MLSFRMKVIVTSESKILNTMIELHSAAMRNFIVGIVQ